LDEKCTKCGGLLSTSLVIIPTIIGHTVKYDYTKRCTECRTRITLKSTYETPVFKETVEG